MSGISTTRPPFDLFITFCRIGQDSSAALSDAACILLAMDFEKHWGRTSKYSQDTCEGIIQNYIRVILGACLREVI